MAHAPILHVHVRPEPKDSKDTFRVFVEGREDDGVTVAFTAEKAGLKEQLDGLHDRSAHRFMTFGEQEPVCQELGQQLFNTFFKPPMLKHYRDYRDVHETPRVALHLARCLYWLPWELLRDPEDPYGQFLSVLGSVIRFDDEGPGPKDPIFQPVDGRLNFLFLLSDPIGRGIGDFEPADDYSAAFGFQRVRPPTYDNFRQTIAETKPFGWIFFGHGEIDENTGALVFVKQERRRLFTYSVPDRKPAHSIGDAIGVAKWMRVAGVFACESAWAKDAVTFERSVAGALLNRTLMGYVIAAQTPLDVAAAHEFLDAAFKALTEGLPLDLVLGRARQAVRSMDPASPTMQFSCLDWWVPVLYSRTTSFDILPPKPPVPLPELIQRGTAIPMQVPAAIPVDMRTQARAVLQAMSGLFRGDDVPFETTRVP